MASLYEIEKQLESLMELKTVIESIKIQVQAMGLILGIDVSNPPDWYVNGDYSRPDLHIVEDTPEGA